MKDGPPNDLYTPLQSFIQDLLSSSPSCFILPTVWGAVRTVFERMSKPDAKSVKPVGSLRVIRANDRLAFWTVKDRLPHRPPSLEVVEILDATLYASSLDEPSTACLALVPDRFELTMSLIAWACSKSRASMAHIYTACRIFWTWAHQVRFNVRACLVEAAKVSEHYRGLCPLAVGRLLAELTRSGHFDMDTYLRSASANDAAPVHDNKREILMQAPFANLPVETQRRCMQLIPSIMGVGAMKDNIKGLQAKIAVSLKAVLAGHASELSSSKLHGMLDHLSARDRFDLGKWLRASLLPLLTGKMKDSEAVLPYNFVELVLLLLEQLDDFAQLRDVMSAVASKSDVESLHLVALCGEAHGDVLVSLGHYSKLRRAVLGRYRTLRASSTGPHRALCQLLLRGLNLAAFVVDDEQFLQREIDFCDPGIAAYTPLSDIDMDSAEDEMSDLDRLLANGPSLAEEQLLAALNMILNHVCQVKDATHTQIETITCNLQALRRANRDRFMPTLTSCVRAMSDNLDDAAMLRLGSILLLDDEMELDDLAACIDGVVAVAPDVGIADCSALLALRILTFFYGTKPEHGELPTSSDDAFEIWLRSPLIGWKRSVMAKQLECAHPHALIDLLVVGLGINTYGHADLRSLLMSPDLIGLVHRLLRNVDSGFLKEMHTLLRSASPTTSENLRELVAVVVDLPGHLQHLSHPMTADAVQSVLDHLFTTVGPNSLHPYKLCMSWVASSSRHTTVSPTAISDICYRQCHEASSHEATLWHELMASIDPLVADDMRSHAEQAIMFCPESNEALSKRLQARWSIAPTTHTSIFNTIKPNLQLDISPDKARLIARHLSIATKFCERDLADIPMFADWLQALLHLALIYHDSFKPGSILVSLLHTLCRLTTSTQLASRSDLISLPYDMACFFAPRADNASLAILRTHLADILDNERIRFLLGDQPLPPPASQVVSNISSLTPSPAFPTTTRTTTASSLAPSPATTSSTSRMTPAAPVEPISFGTRKWNSLSPPRLDKDLLDAAFRVWEKYREDS